MQTHQSVTRDIHRPRMPAAHDGLSKHGDTYGIRWRTGKTKCCVSTEVADHETTSNIYLSELTKAYDLKVKVNLYALFITKIT